MFRIAGHHHSRQALRRRQVQTGHLRLRAMAGITLRGKDGAHLLFVELQLFGGGLSQQRTGHKQSEQGPHVRR